MSIKSDIIEATAALKEIMQEGLADIADNMIAQIVSRASRSTPSNILDSIKDVSHKGVAEYKAGMLEAMAVLARASLEQAQKEIPGKIRLAGEGDSIKLSEFENLPPKIRKKILGQSQLLIDTQISDLDKTVFYQFQSSAGSTDSMALLKADLDSAAEDFITGSSIVSGAAATAASIVNNVRNAFFLDEQVTEQLDAFIFTNGDPVSKICTDLDGTIFSADDPNLNRYWPPLHFNCKSYILPILKGKLGKREIEKLNPSKSAEDSIQFSESCACAVHKRLLT